MIITEKFIYIHWPKTGGTFVEHVLNELESGRGWVGDKHDRVCQIPQPFRDRKVLFTVRNPYDLLVSNYEFEWWKNYPGDPFEEAKMKELYHRYPDISFGDYAQSYYNWTLLSEIGN